jgi:hypothetical protein
LFFTCLRYELAASALRIPVSVLWLEGTGNVLYPALISRMDLIALKVLLCLVKSPCGDSIDSNGDLGSWDVFYLIQTNNTLEA